jgi:hypothetical protein
VDVVDVLVVVVMLLLLLLLFKFPILLDNVVNNAALIDIADSAAAAILALACAFVGFVEVKFVDDDVNDVCDVENVGTVVVDCVVDAVTVINCCENKLLLIEVEVGVVGAVESVDVTLLFMLGVFD